MAAAAIPWAKSNAESSSLSNLDSEGKVAMKQVSHGAASQPGHQALQVQQPITQADKALAQPAVTASDIRSRRC